MERAPRAWVVAVRRRAALAAAVAAGSCVLRLALAAQAPPAADVPRVIVGEYDGVIHPIAAEFVDDLLARADGSGATAAVLVLRTPGGLLESTRTIVSRMISARVPVVVYVAPSGSRAASAGFLIALAADVAVMAPGTHIGAAHPVSAAGGEADRDGATTQKAAEDTAAYARTLAEARRRNPTLAAAAVLESRAFTETEALGAAPPLIDFVASGLDDLLRQLDGREVRRFEGATVTLRTAGARIERLEPTWRQTVLGAIAHPQIAYLLLTLGTLGLIVEFWNPGFVLPGVAGGLCLLLAFFAFQILPINLTGVLLLAFGLALLGAELMVPSFGVLGVGGIVALIAGSLMITREVPDVRVGYGVILPVVAAAAVVMLGLGRLAVQAQRQPSPAGTGALVGATGEALTVIAPRQPGQVRVHGEIWTAASDATIAAGQPLRIVGAEGLTLHVRPADPPNSPGGPS